jgi:hypothetical protein
MFDDNFGVESKYHLEYCVLFSNSLYLDFTRRLFFGVPFLLYYITRTISFTCSIRFSAPWNVTVFTLFRSVPQYIPSLPRHMFHPDRNIAGTKE